MHTISTLNSGLTLTSLWEHVLGWIELNRTASNRIESHRMGNLGNLGNMGVRTFLIWDLPSRCQSLWGERLGRKPVALLWVGFNIMVGRRGWENGGPNF